MRNPAYRLREARRLRAWQDRLERTVVLSGDDIWSRIKDLWNSDKAREAALDLEQQGERSLQPLLSALSEFDFLPVPIEKRWNHDPPLKCILQILERIGAAAAVPFIEPFLRHEASDFRAYAAHAIGMIGAPNCVEPLRLAMRDPDDRVRTWALMGIHRGLKESRVDAVFSEAVFDDVAALVLASKRVSHDSAYSVLLTIDRDRAANLLLSDRVFSHDRPDLHDLIRALTARDVEIAGARLKSIMESIKDRVEEYPFDYVYGASLLALAKQADSEAECLAREAAAWGRERVSEDAAMAVVICNGIDDLWERLWRLEESRGLTNLSRPAQFANACLHFDSQVCNGGLAQYYANLYGTHARIALEGFRAFGANEAARVVSESMALFGPDGPSENEAGLLKQLSKLPDSAFQAMEPLNNAYYKVDHTAKILGLLYVADHADEILE